MVRRFWVGLVLLILVAAVVAARLFAPISTPPFKGPGGRPLEGSIAVAERWPINGVEQSVIIRGRDASNPILIWLHGGPGSSETPILRVLNGRLEDTFTVVYWDQRLAGQTLDPRAPPPESLTVDQMVTDLDVLVDRLRIRLGQDKVVLVGHSWGTMLGVLYASRHPEKVTAYVGIGQMADKPRAETLSYAYAVRQAGLRKDDEALRQLKAIGPPPYSGEEIFVQRAWLDQFGGASYADMSLPRLILMSLGSSEANWRDLYATSHGGVLGARLLEPQLLSRNLDRTYLRFDVPVLIAAGRHDHLTSSTLVRDYFERIEAPAKTFVWFERSGHNPHLEEPAKFNAWLVNALRSTPP